jgi:hypothetical protein
MLLPGSTYTTKKGITKTTQDKWVPAHYTVGGTYIGRVADLGTAPISYPVMSAGSSARTKDMPKSFFKALRTNKPAETTPAPTGGAGSPPPAIEDEEEVELPEPTTTLAIEDSPVLPEASPVLAIEDAPTPPPSLKVKRLTLKKKTEA